MNCFIVFIIGIGIIGILYLLKKLFKLSDEIAHLLLHIQYQFQEHEITPE